MLAIKAHLAKQWAGNDSITFVPNVNVAGQLSVIGQCATLGLRLTAVASSGIAAAQYVAADDANFFLTFEVS